MEAQLLEEIGTLLYEVASFEENVTPVFWKEINEELQIMFGALSDNDVEEIKFNIDRVRSYLIIIDE